MQEDWENIMWDFSLSQNILEKIRKDFFQREIKGKDVSTLSIKGDIGRINA